MGFSSDNFFFYVLTFKNVFVVYCRILMMIFLLESRHPKNSPRIRKPRSDDGISEKKGTFLNRRGLVRLTSGFIVFDYN